MVLIGELITNAAAREGLEGSWYPSYGPEIRGGAANSSYVVSDKAIANPVVADFDVGLIMNNYSMAQFMCTKEKMQEREELRQRGEKIGDRKIRPSGLLIYNSSLILPEEVPERDDITIYPVPASELTDSRIPNMVLLGSYMQAMDRPKIGTLEEIFKEVFTGRKAKFVDTNLKDLEVGMEYVRKEFG